MFGWLKSIFGSKPEPTPVVVPPLPKAKKVAVKADKPAAKKAAPKAKAVKAPKKKKEAVAVAEVVTTEAVETVVEAPKKKGRPKKVS